MKKLVIFSVIGLLFFLPNLFSQSKLSQCQSGKVFNNCYGEITGKHEKGTYKYLGEFQNDKYHGQGEFQVFWNEKSKDPLEQPIKHEGTFAFGKYHGKVKIIYRNGFYEINNYHNGVLNGSSEGYTKENKLKYRTNYSYNGKKMSEIFFFDPPLRDDLIQVERIYSNSVIIKEIEYFKNGTTKVINSSQTASTAAIQSNQGFTMYLSDDQSFVLAAAAVLFMLGLYIYFSSKNKKILKRNTPKKTMTKVFTQSDFSSSGFWHGRKGLALTFWGFFIGGNILLNGVTLIVTDNPNLVIMNLIFFMLWNVLAVMGVFNAANIYKAEKMKLGQSYTGATAAKIAVVLLILSGIGNLIPR